MQVEPQRQEETIYRADPFTFVFRELDLIREDIREIKSEIKRMNERIDNVIFDMNKRFDDMNKRFDDMNKRIDRLFLLVILNLLGIVAFLIKVLFF